MTNFKMTVRADCAVSACRPSLCLQKLLPTDCQRGSWPLDRSPPSPMVAGLQSKANFPFHQLCLFIGFRTTSSQIPLSITLWQKQKSNWDRQPAERKALGLTCTMYSGRIRIDLGVVVRGDERMSIQKEMENMRQYLLFQGWWSWEVKEFGGRCPVSEAWFSSSLTQT